MKKTKLNKQKLEINLRCRVAKKFGIEPISLRATKLLNKHCKDRSQVLEWLKSKYILRIRQMGRKTLNELYCAFGECDKNSVVNHHENCKSAPVDFCVNYRRELDNYAQIFRKGIPLEFSIG